jgi:hypothetical protein
VMPPPDSHLAAELAQLYEGWTRTENQDDDRALGKADNTPRQPPEQEEKCLGNVTGEGENPQPDQNGGGPDHTTRCWVTCLGTTIPNDLCDQYGSDHHIVKSL